MRYTIHTTVDITNTGQYRTEPGAEAARWKEQNFQTVLLTLGIRANISFSQKPSAINIAGDMLGFNTNNIVKVWTFTFETERDNDKLLEFFKQDFDGVPYISGLDESMEQNFDVFVTEGPATNIIFSAS
jgi:hypothetical protein